MATKKVGRPEEEGGHKRQDFSLCASIFEYLEKGEFLLLNLEGVDNKSKFVEKAIRMLVAKHRKSTKHFREYMYWDAEYPKTGFGVVLRPSEAAVEQAFQQLAAEVLNKSL
jgi:hypothetical protein